MNTQLEVDVRVADAAGNYTIVSSTFGFNAVAPAAAVSYPPSGAAQFFSSMTAILGTATAQSAPITQVNVEMYYVTAGTTYYWDPTSTPKHWTATPAQLFWPVSGSAVPANQSGSWSYSVADFGNPAANSFAWRQSTLDGADGHTFNIVVKAQDSAGNTQTAVSTNSFTFDNQAPTSGPTAPVDGAAYGVAQLTTLSGTAADDASGVKSVILYIQDKDASGGAKYFDGSGFTSASSVTLPASLVGNAWTYSNGSLSFTDGHHYVVTSSATDNVNNNGSFTQATFLYDATPAVSNVTNPVAQATYNNNKILSGSASDSGFTAGINGTGGGVYPNALPAGVAPSAPQGKVEVMIFWSTGTVPSSGNFGLNVGWNSSGYFWNGSTWTPASNNLTTGIWVPATFGSDGLGDWQYSGLVCPSPNPTNVPCWVNGQEYSVWSRVTDNAGNVQTVINSGPQFFISAPAQSFAVSVDSDPSTAGLQYINLTVKAVDGVGGSGNRASSYAGTVIFYIDGVPGGPEKMQPSGLPDQFYGLPSTYTFTVGTVGDNGQHTFQMMLRKAGVRTLVVQQNDNPSLSGSVGMTVQNGPAAQVQVIADTAHQQPGPGVTTAGSEGRVGSPNSFLDGQSVTFLAQVVDQYWNLVASSATQVTIVDSDPNDAYANPSNTLSFTGSTTFTRTFVTAGSQTIGLSGSGTYPNSDNPGSAITINGQPADRLVAILPGETLRQGKAGVAPFGKSGTPSDLEAGLPFATTVYGVDAFYNIDTSANNSIKARVYTGTAAQQTQPLVNGTTTFWFTPLVATNLGVEAQASGLPALTSDYVTPNLAPTWWNAPVKLQLLAQGQTAAPGVAPFDSNPTTGGRLAGGPATLTAGVTTQLTVNLVDAYFNVVKGTTPFMNSTQLPVSSYTPVVQLNFPGDPNIQARALEPNPYQISLVAGTTSFSVIPVTRNLAPGTSIQAIDAGLTGTHYSTDTVSGIVVNANPTIAGLQVIVPTEAAADGTVSGKTGAAGPLTAGSSYSVIVRAVDAFNNQASDGRLVGLATNDTYATVPANQPLAAGQATFSGFIPSIATGNLTVTALDQSGGGLGGQTDSGITVNSGAAAKLLMAMSGQTLVGGKTTAPAGLSGPPTAGVAGSSITVTLYATDARYNVVAGVSKGPFNLTTDDPLNASLPSVDLTNGVAVTSVTFYTASTRTITGVDGSGIPTILTSNAGSVYIAPNNPTKLLALLPGQTRVPGLPGSSGHTAGTYTAAAGTPFTVEVDITDTFWNLTPGVTQYVALNSDDGNAIITPAAQIVGSTAAFTVTLKRAGSTVLWAQLGGGAAASPALAVDSTTPVNVTPGSAQRLLIAVQGEGYSQGSVSGKAGAPQQETAGTSFSVQVAAVDAFNNLAIGNNDTVQLSFPSDPYAPAVAPVSINPSFGYTNPPITVTLRKAATGQYLAATDTSGPLSPDTQSSTFTVIAANPIGLQLVLPGQTAVPGSGNYPNGSVTGTISTATAGGTYVATVNLVDQYMNLVTSQGNFPNFYVQTNDAYGQQASTAALSNGTLTVPLNLVTKTKSAVVTVGVRGGSVGADLVCTANLPTNQCSAQAPAAQSPAFTVFASTADHLMVLVPNETLAPGKCTVSPGTVCRSLAPSEGEAGVNFSPPSTYTITSPATAMTATVYLVDKYNNQVTDIPAGNLAQDTNPPAVMPTVKLSFPQDPLLTPPAAQTLSLGAWPFAITPFTAISTYTVVATTTSASASTFSAAASDSFVVFPGPAHHINFSNVPASVQAGQTFRPNLTAYDQYNNVLSTGPNAYQGTVAFLGETFTNSIQNTSFVPNPITFSSSVNQGVITSTPSVTMFKTGNRWMEAFDQGNSAVNTNVAGFSVNPVVTVTPGPAASVSVTPSGPSSVSAGQLVPSNPGSVDIQGQIADAYGNALTAATSVYISIATSSVVQLGVGTTGYLAVNYADGRGWINVGASTTVFSDANGLVGITTPTIAYFVSSHAGDWARIWVGTTTAPTDLTAYLALGLDVSGKITTTGGVPSKLVFTSSATQITAGITEITGDGGVYALTRYDDFGNVTTQGTQGVALSVLETAAHTSNGYSMGLTGNTGDYGFRDAANGFFISGFTIADGENGSEHPFRYHDRLSSYSGVDPATNTGEGGRPGTWTLRATMGSAIVDASVRVDPGPKVKVGVPNAGVAQAAGTVLTSAGSANALRAWIEDIFGNPVVAAAPTTVSLSSVTRAASAFNDAWGFSASSGTNAGSLTVAPSFQTPANNVTIGLNNYQTTFYYLDTTASEQYSTGGSTIAPVIQVSIGGLTALQFVVPVGPDVADRVAVSSGVGQTLLAGATSQAFGLQTQDSYGNGSPITVGQLINGYVRFRMTSDSAGNVQFSTPTVGNFVKAPGTAYMTAGQQTTSFFLIDTLVSATTHTLTVSSLDYPTWQSGVSTYTVIPGPPAQLAWISPARRLIAGTTTEYYPDYTSNTTTNTVATVQLQDQFGNAATVTQTYDIQFFSNKQTTYVGSDPACVIVAYAPAACWTPISPTAFFDANLPAGSGINTVNLYFWDTGTTTTTLTAQAVYLGANVFSPAVQSHVITPGPASYITIHHPYTTASPLRVNTPGVVSRSTTSLEAGEPATIGVVARDQFGNIASGDVINGQYYSGKVVFATSGSTATVTLRDPLAGTTYHIFVPSEQGDFTNMQVTDQIQESLQVWATDYANAGLYGYTNDVARGGIPGNPAYRSDGNINLAGVKIIPQDFSPETPQNPVKVALGMQKQQIFQGDGTAGGSLANPVPMLRLDAKVVGGTGLIANLSQLRVFSRPDNTLNNSHITEMALWWDQAGGGGVQATDNSLEPGSVLVATGAYSAAEQAWHFGDPTFGQTTLDNANPTAAAINTGDKFFFVTVRVASTGFTTGELPASFGLQLKSPGDVVLSTSSQVGVAKNNFLMQTTTSPVVNAPATIHVYGTDIGAWWAPPAQPTASYPYVNQGVQNVGFLKLQFVTDAFNANITQIGLTHTGSNLDADIGTVRLYLCTDAGGDPDNCSGSFAPAVDIQVASTTFPSGETRNATLVINDPTGVNGTVGISTRTYFVAYDIRPTATAGLTTGMSIAHAQITTLGGNGTIASFNPFVSTAATVMATQDVVRLDGWDTQGVSGGSFVSSIPSKFTQNDINDPAAKLTLDVPSGSALWTGVKLDRWIPSTENGGAGSYNSSFALNNKASDVKNIRIWQDSNGDGLLETSSDTVVSPANTTVHNFPTATLVSPIDPTLQAACTPALAGSSFTVTVDNIQSMFPPDNPFTSDTDERLVFNDGQTDELQKEIVHCYGVNLGASQFTNCYRGQEGTCQLGLAFTTSTVISGPARIPIPGGLGAGVGVVSSPTNYFVTFDIDPQASVSNQSNLGLVIPSTTYMQIAAPKSMSTFQVGIPTTGISVSLVPQMAHVADFVRVVSTDAADPSIGSFAQQGSTVAMAAFTMNTGISSEQWRWMLFYATGTATSNNQVAPDVDLVSVWYDANGDNVLETGGPGCSGPPACDVMIGTGTFGNYGGLPLVTRVGMNTPYTITTPTLAPQVQRFFVAYHVTSSALPTDPITSAPRSLGVVLQPSSLPTNSPSVDNDQLNALALPDLYDPSSPLPFSSKLRPIIASPQTLYVKATPMFSNSTGTFPSPTLLNAIVTAPPAGTIDPSWVISSTQGLPLPLPGTTSYAVVDNEIVSYTGFGAGPSLLNVTRGALNTLTAAHGLGAVVGTMLQQGAINNAIMKLEVWASADQIQFSSVTLTRLLPPGLFGQDSDISNVRIWQSITSGDGYAFHRNPVNGVDVGDTLMGTSGFGLSPNPPGKALLPLNDPAINSPGYTLVTASTKTFYISVDVSPTAKFSYPTLSPANEVTGGVVVSTTEFVLTPSNAGHQTRFVDPVTGSPTLTSIQSAGIVLMPTINTVTADLVSFNPNSALENQTNVPMLRMKLSTDHNSAIIQKIKVDRLGAPNGGVDSDITLVKVWKDPSGVGAFDASVTTRAADGSYPNLVSFGNESFSSGTLTFTLPTQNQIVVTTAPAYYFITYDINQFAAVGSQTGISLANNVYMTAQVPNVVVFAQGSFATSPLMTINKVTSHVTLGEFDAAQSLGTVSQGENNANFLRFSLVTDVALAPWRSMIVKRTGGSQDPNFPQGRNTDVRFVRVYKDLNQNDTLDASDLNISEVATSLKTAITAAQAPPFDLVVVSTQGFPRDNTGAMVGGTVFLGNAELMTFSGPGCQTAPTPGVDPATGSPCLAITSRANVLGNSNTPQLSWAAGTQVKKVDVFDQLNQSDVQHTVFLNNDQFIGPTANIYFLAYDISDSAIQNNQVGVGIDNPAWFGFPLGDQMTQTIYENISQIPSKPLGTDATTYPFVGFKPAISPIQLSVSGFTIAPTGGAQGQQNVPLLELQMHTNADYVNIGQLRLTQLGTVRTSTTTGVGDGDLSKLSVWLDNGSQVFTPTTETELGFVVQGSSFTGGVGLVKLNNGALPYVTVGTQTVTIYIAGDIGYTDVAGTSTLNHQVGVEIAQYADMMAANGATLPASADPSNTPPIGSRNVTIAPLTVPSVSITTTASVTPIILVKSGPGTGFPAFALTDPINCNNGKDANNLRNDICRDGNGNPLPNTTLWMCPDGSRPWPTNCPTASPLIDVNGDGIPDNFSFGASSVTDQISLAGDGIPARDITGTGILDMDLNKDGIVDLVVPNGFGGFQVLLGNDPTDQGNTAKMTPVPDQGFVPSSWAGSTNRLAATLPMISTDPASYYQVSAGAYYDSSLTWSSVTLQTSSLSRLHAAAVSASSASLTTALLTGLSMKLPNIAHLTQALTPNTTVFTVDGDSSLDLKTNGGLIYVGSEIMRVKALDSKTLAVISQQGDPSPGTGRGLHGSVPIQHLTGEVVSDAATIFFARFVQSNGTISPARAMFVYRPDPTAPGVPGTVQILEAGKPSYPLRWNTGTTPPSDVIAYEVQERGGDAKDLASVVLWHTLNIIPATNPTYTVGDSVHFAGESPRPVGQYFSYRVRSISGAGVSSPWSTESINVNTGATSGVISGVSNYPNPFDSRQGLPAGQTTITYTLGSDADVEIVIYDLLGYVVKSLHYSAGSTGGRQGPNFVTWDGKNGSGAFVSKGGYIARIKVKAATGSSIAIRKIGVIH